MKALLDAPTFSGVALAGRFWLTARSTAHCLPGFAHIPPGAPRWTPWLTSTLLSRHDTTSAPFRSDIVRLESNSLEGVFPRVHRRLPASNAARRMSSIAANATQQEAPTSLAPGTPLTGVSKVSEKVGSLPLLAFIPMQYWPAARLPEIVSEKPSLKFNVSLPRESQFPDTPAEKRYDAEFDGGLEIEAVAANSPPPQLNK